MNKLNQVFLMFILAFTGACMNENEPIEMDTQTQKIPELKFTFEDSVYIINNPKIDRYFKL